LLYERALGIIRLFDFGGMLLNVYIKDPQQDAQACVIWMHGLGADAQDMAGLASQLPVAVAIRHVFMDAPVRPVTLNNNMPMRAWYDILGMALTDREDHQGIKQSEDLIRQVVDNQVAEGFSTEQIFLAGFSQGGAMALYTGLHTSAPLGGIIALSAYLPLAAACNVTLNSHTPIFLAGGLYDPIVLPMWTKQSLEFLRQQDFKDITWHEYPMEHNICAEEIRDIAQWLTQQVTLINNVRAGEKQ
jgi:phospholipase/carboxylesterase